MYSNTRAVGVCCSSRARVMPTEMHAVYPAVEGTTTPRTKSGGWFFAQQQENLAMSSDALFGVFF